MCVTGVFVCVLRGYVCMSVGVCFTVLYLRLVHINLGLSIISFQFSSTPNNHNLLPPPPTPPKPLSHTGVSPQVSRSPYTTAALGITIPQ